MNPLPVGLETLLAPVRRARCDVANLIEVRACRHHTFPSPPLAPGHACRNVRKGNSDAKPLIGKGATHDPLASRRCRTASLVAVPARACPEGHGRIVGLERARRVPQPGARGGRGRLPAPDRDDRAGADRVVRAGSGRRAARGSVPRPVVRARPHDCLSRRRSPDNIRAVSIRLVVLLTLGALAGCRTSTAAPTSGGPPPPPPPPGAPTVHVQGTRLVDSAGRPIRLRGVNRSGTEYACAQGWGMFDGPSDSASVQAIASW